MIRDDEVDLLHLFKYALEPAYDVFIVDSGKDCIKKFLEEKHRGKKVDVLLLDYRLGDKLGDIVACKVHELDGVKTILITAYELEQVMVDHLIKKRCITGIMKKPIRMPTIINEMEKVISSSNFP